MTMTIEACARIRALGARRKMKVLIRTLLRHTGLIGETQRQGHHLASYNGNDVDWTNQVVKSASKNSA